MQEHSITLKDIERFFAKITFTNTCWLWTGGHAHGYGHWHVGSLPAGTRRTILCHRWAYEFCVGLIPAGLTLDHLCRVRNCVNPDHLEPMSLHLNILRGTGIAAHNSALTHCRRGHPFSGPNLYIVTRANGRTYRRCLACTYAQVKARRLNR